MYNFKNTLLGNLSGGQQQRILIARALMGNPEILILDEPSTGVDEINQKEIYTVLNTLNKDKNKTIISIEHNINIAIRYSTHILKVHNGTINLYTVKDYIKVREQNSILDNAI